MEAAVVRYVIVPFMGAGKILGAQKIFARFSPNLPEKILCDSFLPEFWNELKKVFM